MTALHAIMRDYFTIIRDYFHDYFTDYFAIIYDYTRLFYRLHAIFLRRRHPENGNVQTAILHPIMEEWVVFCFFYKFGGLIYKVALSSIRLGADMQRFT